MTLRVLIAIVSLVCTSALAADKKYGMADLNTEIIVEIKNRPTPTQTLQKTGLKEKALRWVLNFGANPVPVRPGERLPLQVWKQMPGGKKEDITKSPYLRFDRFTSPAEITKDAILVIRESVSPGQPPSALYGVSDITAEYITPSGEIGFNGFAIEVIPCEGPACPKLPGASRPTPDQIAADAKARADEQRERVKKSGQGPQPLAKDAFRYLESLDGITVKRHAADLVQMVVFFDPNCPACRNLWRDLYGEGSRHREVASKWVPVSYMDNTSSGRIATLMQKRSPELLARNFRDFDRNRRQGAVPESPISPETAEAVRVNVAAWKKLYPATPLIAFQTKDGDFYQIGHIEGVAFDDIVTSLAPRRLAPYQGP